MEPFSATIPGLKPENGEARVTRPLRDNRFWIGETLYPRYVEYSQRQRALFRAYDGVAYRVFGGRATKPILSREDFNEALEEVQQRRQELLEARADVVDVMAELS
jgi:hypothetical protein